MGICNLACKKEVLTVGRETNGGRAGEAGAARTTGGRQLRMAVLFVFVLAVLATVGFLLRALFS